MSQQINLFNPIFLKKKKYFSAVTMVQGLGIILLGAVAVSGYAKYQMSSLDKEAKWTSEQLAAVQAKSKKVSAEYGPKQKDKTVDDALQQAEAELAGLQKVFAILEKGNFGDTAGYAEYMRAFARQTIDGVWLTSFSIQGAGNDISLQGRALKPDLVPAYISRLKNETALQGKSFSAFEMLSPSTDGAAKGTALASSSGHIDFRLQSSTTSGEQERARTEAVLAMEQQNARFDALEKMIKPPGGLAK